MIPARSQPRANGERPAWRERLEADVGEDPGAFLDQEMTDAHGRWVVPDVVEARIRGIDRLDRIGAWIAAERRLGRGDDGGPRDIIIGLLEERRAELQEAGERPRDIRAAIEDDPSSVPNRHWPRKTPDDVDKPPLTRYDEEGNPYRLVTKRGGLTIQYLDDERTDRADVDADDRDAVATDGGGPS